MSKSQVKSPSKKSDVKTIEDKYQKLEPHDHILKKPGMYIGSTKKHTAKMWIFNEEAKTETGTDPKIILKEITYVPGFYKICDEIYVNARDRTAEKLKIPCTKIKITVDKKTGRITVWNNGDGVDVAEHKKFKMYVPSMIFGETLSSTQFDDADNDKRVTGGTNGLGAKLANIYSVEFEVTTLDASRDLKFYQKFTRNMYDKQDPKVVDAKGKTPFTQISFIADFEKFGLKGITTDMFNLLKKRAYDIAMNSTAKVYFNDELITENNLQKYAELYFPSNSAAKIDAKADSPKSAKSDADEDTEKANDDLCPKIFDLKSNPRWKIGVAYDKTNMFDHENISFVNGICTNNGGTHVAHVINQIVARLREAASKKLGGVAVKPELVKENLIFFIDSVIVSPQFNSQTKEQLSTNVKEFGSEYKLTETLIKNIIKTGIIDTIVEKATKLATISMGKNDGKKTDTVKGIDKLSDADKAGTKESESCGLFLTEGDSAKALAVAGRSIIGHEYYGVFPLRGKLKNVNGKKKNDELSIADLEKIKNNAEVKAIMTIVGLKTGKVYTSLKELRYGHIIIFTDQDVDGFHIKGLLMNFINHFWPSLIQYEGFIQCFPTPIVKMFKGVGANEKTLSFYNLPDLEKWKTENNDGKGWHAKYYKGLGTSTPQEARDYFEDFAANLLTYYCPEIPKNKSDKDKKKSKDAESEEEKLTYKPKYKDPTREAISLAFDKTRADDRKIWMNAYNAEDYIKSAQKRISYPDFIDKELRAHAIYNASRAVPCLMDGLKPGQRKIYYTCIRKNLYTKPKEVRVSQLAGAVSELACYHHGETSLQGAIIKMAQNYVGANNLNLLVPSGTFGTRLEGGDDAASARYIHTYLEDIGKKIFIPEDYPILNQQDDDGTPIEPQFYAPIMPMILVNGVGGIGTGYSSDIEPCNPRDIEANLRRILKGESPKKMMPWYRHFTGQVEKIDDQRFLIRAAYEIIDSDTLHITDLPIGEWTEKYKSFIAKLIERGEEKKKEEKANARKQTAAKGKATKGKGKVPAPKAKGKAGSKVAAKTAAKTAAKPAVKGKPNKKTRVAKVAKTNTIGQYIKSCTEHCTDVKIDITIVFQPGKLKKLVETGKLEKELKLSKTVQLTNMHLFNEEGKIIKYKTYGEILKNYSKVRLELYQKRKDYLLDKWTKEMDMLAWKVKFIEHVIDGKIVVFKDGKTKKKEQVLAKLEELGFPKFADTPTETPSYSYTEIGLYKLTTEEVNKLKEELEKKKLDIKTLQGKSPAQLWSEELDEFMVAYDKWEEASDAAYNASLQGKKKKAAKKQPVKKNVVNKSLEA